MKFSKVVFGTIFVMVFAAFANVSFAMAKDHDGEIVAYMQAIDNHEVSVSKVAKDKKVDAEVMNFADMMITQHSDNLQKLSDLMSKNSLTADETSNVKMFKENGDKGSANLSKLDDAKFQKAYIKAMIKGHTDVNNMLAKFEKEVQNSNLKEYLVDTKKMVEEHLADAKKLK